MSCFKHYLDLAKGGVYRHILNKIERTTSIFSIILQDIFVLPTVSLFLYFDLRVQDRSYEYKVW